MLVIASGNNCAIDNKTLRRYNSKMHQFFPYNCTINPNDGPAKKSQSLFEFAMTYTKHGKKSR